MAGTKTIQVEYRDSVDNVIVDNLASFEVSETKVVLHYTDGTTETFGQSQAAEVKKVLGGWFTPVAKIKA